jgi:hypothetical protein
VSGCSTKLSVSGCEFASCQSQLGNYNCQNDICVNIRDVSISERDLLIEIREIDSEFKQNRTTQNNDGVGNV